MEEITLVIQGPLHHHAVNKIVNYSKIFENIIYSCWDYDERKHEMATLNNALNLGYKLEIVKSNLDGIKNFHNSQNIFYQTLTTLNGTNFVKTKFVIKTRCDEFYLGLGAFAKEVIDNPDFIINTNIFFRPDSCCKFHSSDHLIGGKTSIIQKGFNSLYLNLLNNKYNEPAECLITKNLLLAKDVQLDYSKSREIMKNNFRIFRLSDLSANGPIMVSCGNKFFRSEAELIAFDNIPRINNMQDI